MGEKVEGGENSSTTVEVKKQSVTRKESWEQKMRHNSSEAVMRSILREHAVVKFVLMVTHGTKPENADFADWLRDGSVLMDLMTTLAFNSVPKECFGAVGVRPEIERIQAVIETMRNYGVEKKNIFTLEDLWEKKNIDKVLTCLEEVEKLARKEEHVVLDVSFNTCNKVYL